MPTWTQIASDGFSPVEASKLMSCSVGEAIRQIETAKDETLSTTELRASFTVTTWMKLAYDGVPPHIAAKLRGCSIADAIAHLSSANNMLPGTHEARLVHGSDLFRVAASEARMPIVEIADIPAGLMTPERARKMDATECAHHAAFAIENGHSHLEQAPRIANYEAR